MAGGQLKRVDDAQQLGKIAACRHRIGHLQLDPPVRPDNKHHTHRLVVDRAAPGRTFTRRRRQHVIELGNRKVGIGDDRILRPVAGYILDIGKPLPVIVSRVDRQAYNLDIAPRKLVLKPGQRPKLGGTDRCEILGMREQNAPAASQPVVECDLAMGSLRCEIRCDVVDSQNHPFLL